MRTLEQLDGLQRTNAELVIRPFYGRSDNGFGMNVQLPHFSDIRVRIAMQKAINFDEINNAYWRGFGRCDTSGAGKRLFFSDCHPI